MRRLMSGSAAAIRCAAAGAAASTDNNLSDRKSGTSERLRASLMAGTPVPAAVRIYPRGIGRRRLARYAAVRAGAGGLRRQAE